MTDYKPVDVDVHAMEPRDLARLLITRAVGDHDWAWAEIACDLMRYDRKRETALTLLAIVQQMIGILADERGMTAADLWQALMLDEALATADPSGGP